MFENFLQTSVFGRAVSRGLVTVDFVQIRDFAPGNYKHADDTPYGGGAGMVMKCQPVIDALNSIRTDESHVVMTSANGIPYTQKKARELSEKDHLVILCGHYEGMDARIESFTDEQISIGDYVLSGGELASMVIMDSVVRLLKGAIRDESVSEESYENGLLEYPQYTHPAEYCGMKVPDVLLSGNHAKIREYRLKESLRLTKQRRPDLLEKRTLSEEETRLLKETEEDG